MKRCISEYKCPIEATLELIGGKYKALILWHLTDGTLRFGELCRRIPDASQKMLIQQLKDMEENGLLKRHAFPEVPPKVEYSLTDFGRTVVPILDVMCRWGECYLNKPTEEKI